MSKEWNNQEFEAIPAPEFTDLTAQDAKQFKDMYVRFLKSFAQKPEGLPLRDWLTDQLRQELPALPEKELGETVDDIISTTEQYDKDLKDLRATVSAGVDKKRWVADRLQEASVGVPVAEFGAHMFAVDHALKTANDQMRITITRLDNGISGCYNLDGYIAEQALVNSFNAEAALKGASVKAEVCVPTGTYGKNSFDAVIRDAKTNRILHQYQVKYGATAQDTIQLLKRGNYDNQTLVVPPEQVAEVQAAFPGKTVTSILGGTEKVPIASKSFTKAEVKAMQTKAQQQGEIPKITWNNYNTRELALQIGGNAAVAGVQGAAIATGLNLAAKVIMDEPIDAEETIMEALETGTDIGIKCATAGALKVAAEKGILKCIPVGTSACVLTTVACVAVENVKVAMKIASGEYTSAEGLDKMAESTCTAVVGLSWAAKGTMIGAAALSWLPIVGPVVGGLVGGIVGYTAGSTAGHAVYNGVKRVATAARSAAKKFVSGATKAVRTVAGLFRN